MTRIVMADDHKFFRSGVEAALRAQGIEVVASVDDGAAALQAVRQFDPDIVILDVNMPGQGGVATLQALRDGGDNRPVIILAAEIADEALVALIKSGVNAIVLKTGAELRLLDAIEAIGKGTSFIDRELIERAFSLAQEGTGQSKLDKLSPRERQVVNQIALGRRNREIAEEFNVTEGTIKIYLNKIYAKLGMTNRTELAIFALDESRNR